MSEYEDMRSKIEVMVWSDISDSASGSCMRSALVECAMDICHETGDRKSFIEFCARVIRGFLNDNLASLRRPPPTETDGVAGRK